MSFNANIIPSMAEPKTIKQGIYSLDNLNLSPDAQYTVQNNSFNERAYILIFDSKPNFLQAMRLRPQSKKYKLIPIQADYKILIVGEGEVTIS